MTFELQLKLLAFEKCKHCADVYFFHLQGIMPETGTAIVYLTMSARCRQEAFGILNGLRQYSGEPMTDAEYNRRGMEIVCSSLPECMPEVEVCARQHKAHIEDVKVLGDIHESMRLLHMMENYMPKKSAELN